MDALKLTFVNGETVSVPFGADSTLTVDTPDGVNGVKRGAWGEVADVEYVKDADAEPVATDAATAHADELGVDLAQVEGTGAEGRITKADVAAAATDIPEA